MPWEADEAPSASKHFVTYVPGGKEFYFPSLGYLESWKAVRRYPVDLLHRSCGQAGARGVKSLGAVSSEDVDRMGKTIPQFLCSEGWEADKGKPLVARVPMVTRPPPCSTCEVTLPLPAGGGVGGQAWRPSLWSEPASWGFCCW